ncbi:MAG: RDD family protein, partial [Fulvivirga sp.]|nr:RDD family protein [Fulvivirga sp.]
MQNVNIRTAQNVGIQYELAGLGNRIAAFVIDAVILFFYLIVVMWMISQIQLNSIWILFGFYLPVLFYHLICEVFFNGQSIGKKQMKIKVVQLDGSSPTFGAYILRWILRLVDISTFSGAIAVVTISMSKHGQRLGDMAAGTTVVKVEREVKVA